ncbi:hypothetical protein [Nostoc sp. ChiQUE01b]|uniref:hypothetical protein n=1 Tax=Nostoc sp. ChiQUE01b TaxID=3075376 RepID=UPI002AD1E28D|nr:hypothetical protein [Nostoc sp. ChiQUE01b]
MDDSCGVWVFVDDALNLRFYYKARHSPAHTLHRERSQYPFLISAFLLRKA